MSCLCETCGFFTIHNEVKCVCQGSEEITQIRKRFAKLKAVAAMEKYIRDRNNVNYSVAIPAQRGPSNEVKNL